MNNHNIKISQLLILSAFCVLIGRGYEYLFWDSPIRVLMWRQDWMESIVNLFDYSWEEYASSPTMDKIFNLFSRTIAWLFIISSIAIFFIKSNKKADLMVTISFVFILFVYILLYIDNFSRIGYLIEHSIQIGAVLMPVLYFKERISQKTLLIIIQWLVALTFIGHGLYATAYYPVPGEFVDMLYYVFKFEEKTALSFLYIVGIIDIIFGIYILLPFPILQKLKYLTYSILFYLAFWGIITGFARIYTGFAMSITIDSFHEEFYKFVFRIPHGLYPFIIFYYINGLKQK
jgi:hypothetical protein